jgi:hypothetical protein
VKITSPGVLRDLREDPLEMRFAAHHRPEMTQHLDIVELRQRRLGDILQRLAGGIGEQMQVQFHLKIACLDSSVENMGEIASATRRTRQAGDSVHAPGHSSTTAPTATRSGAQPVDNGDS